MYIGRINKEKGDTRLDAIGVGRGTTVTVWATDESGASNATSAPVTFTATVPNSRPAVAAIADWTVDVSNGSTSAPVVTVTDRGTRRTTRTR